MKLLAKFLQRPLVGCLVAVAVVQGSFSAFAAKTTYNLTSDWSNSENPNGAWSYNYNSTPISIFQNFWWGQAGWGNNWIGDGGMIKGDYPAGQIDPWGTPVGPAHDWQPGDVMMHAISVPYGGESTFLNFTWTSPVEGKIDISGRAWDGAIFADRDVGWELRVDGNIVARRDSVIGLYRGDADAQFNANQLRRNGLKNIRVHAGTVVEFRVITKTYYGHFVGVDATIKLNSSRPPVQRTIGRQPRNGSI